MTQTGPIGFLPWNFRLGGRFLGEEATQIEGNRGTSSWWAAPGVWWPALPGRTQSGAPFSCGETPPGQPPAQAAGGCLRTLRPFQYAVVIGCLF